MTHRQISHLRACRDKAGLTQVEFARLVGWRTAGTVGRYERSGQLPPARVTLACQVVFGSTPRAMFPTAYGRIEDDAMREAAKLSRRIGDREDTAARKKRRLLAAMVKRAGVSPVEA